MWQGNKPLASVCINIASEQLEFNCQHLTLEKRQKTAEDEVVGGIGAGSLSKCTYLR